jgi:Asp-tRNA(Asn)/Glu-tRNA(Gln) amidotransferase A subunit family amidase
MALSWTYDKLGPMCRSVEDCALVFDAIHGADPKDPTSVSAPFRWEPDSEVRGLRVGVVQADIEALESEPYQSAIEEALRVLAKLGVALERVEIPDYPYQAVYEAVRGSEAAVGFEDLIVGGHLDTLVNEGPNAWKSIFPVARLTPAVVYLKAQQMRALMQADAARLLEDVDVCVAPADGPASPVETPALAPRPATAARRPSRRATPFGNSTGLPAVCVPGGFIDGLPIGIQFLGRPLDDATPLRLAHAYQRATGWHEKHPPI